MAEVSLRLLRSKARQCLFEEKIPCGRKHGGPLVPPYLVLSDSIGAVIPKVSHRLGFYTLWPSRAHRDRTLSTHMSSREAVRLYSHWAGSRSSYHQNGSRRNGANGSAQDSESPLYRSRTAYYDILGVTGNATQSQIKAAYYKQTFRFHPDRYSGSEDAALKFGLVTEAYHILGSVSLRKKYDRGILSLEDVRSAKKPSGKSSSPSRKEAGGRREASMTTSSTTTAKPMFDFDAFYQAHYGEQLAREKEWKARREYIERQKLEKKAASRFNNMGDMAAMLLIISIAAMLTALR